MSWLAELAGKAENILNNIDEQTGVALRNHTTNRPKKRELNHSSDKSWNPNIRTTTRSPRRSYESSRSSSPIKSLQPQPFQPHLKEKEKNMHKLVKKKLPERKNNIQSSTPISTMISSNKVANGEWSSECLGLRRRRYSLSGDMDTLKRDNIYKLQNLEVENAMLKNEINVMNKEISDLFDRLRRAEDEYSHFKSEQKIIDLQFHKLKLDNESLTQQLEQLRLKIQEANSAEYKNREQSQELEAETSLLKSNVSQLEERLKETNEEVKNKEVSIAKLENELRHAQAVISEQQGSIEKSTSECLRLEKDWESYKLRVKGMLFAKDEQLKKLREGSNLTEDAQHLMEEIESLKREKGDLTEELAQEKAECENLHETLNEMNSRHSAVEKIVLALRDALKDERSARNKAETQCSVLGKELKSLQLESGQTIANLRASLQATEEELNAVRESSQSPTTDTSALNVADYDVAQVALDNQRMEYLTQMLVQKQGRVESLLADNNTLRIQLDKLQTKYKTEVASTKAANAHSIVNFQDGDARPRSRTNNYSPASTLAQMSLRVGVLSKRYPIFRAFIVFYMIGLHLWVFTVLFSSTPEDYVRPSKA